jgi:hypothetical protein
MRLLRARGASHALLLSLLVALAAFAYLGQTVNRRDHELASASSAITTTMLQSQWELAGELQSISLDTPMLQNLGWKLVHSVKSSLNGRVRRGVLDHLELFSDQCQSLAHSSLIGNFSGTCNKEASASIQSRTLTHDGDRTLTVTRSLRGIDGSPLYVSGSVKLDDQWLTRHGELKTALERFGLHLAKPEDRGVLLLGQDGNELSLKPIRLRDALLTRIPRRILNRTVMMIGPIFAGILLLIMTDFWRRRSEFKEVAKTLGGHLAFTSKLIPASAAPSEPSEAPTSLLGHLRTTLSAAEETMTRALALKAEALHHAQLKKQILESEIRQKDTVLESQKNRLAELAELDALAMQLERTLSSFLHTMMSLREHAADTEDGIAKTLYERAKAQETRLAAWRQGLTERGTRKFIRSLAETPGTTHETKLEDELNAILAETAEIADLSHKIRTDARKTLAQVTYATKIAALWQGITLKSKSPHENQGLEDILEQAQDLIHLDKKYSDIRFNPNDPSFNAIPLPPAIPEPLWVASLHQLYLASLELTPLKGVQLKTHVRRDHEQCYLIVQLAHPSSDLLPHRSDRQNIHLDIAESMLAPFGVTVTALPVLKGPAPIAMKWRRPDIDQNSVGSVGYTDLSGAGPQIQLTN